MESFTPFLLDGHIQGIQKLTDTCLQPKSLDTADVSDNPYGQIILCLSLLVVSFPH